MALRHGSTLGRDVEPLPCPHHPQHLYARLNGAEAGGQQQGRLDPDATEKRFNDKGRRGSTRRFFAYCSLVLLGICTKDRVVNEISGVGDGNRIRPQT